MSNTEVTKDETVVDNQEAPESTKKTSKKRRKTETDPTTELRSLKREYNKLKKECESFKQELEISQSKNEVLFNELRAYKDKVKEIDESNERSKRILFEGISNSLNAFNNSK